MGMKRKTVITLMGIIFIMVLCGCGSNSATNTIGPWDTPDQQSQAAIEILSNGGLSSFAGFDVDETYKSAKMGIEYYRDGKLVKDREQGTFAIDEPSQGIAGFNCVKGKATMGLSAGGNTGVVSKIRLPGYVKKDKNNLSLASMSESKEISDGQRIYFGMINSGSDSVDTSVLDPSADKGSLTGKNWLFYVEFSAEPLE